MQKQITDMSLEEILALPPWECPCGKVHKNGIKRAVIKRGAVYSLPSLLRELDCKKPHILSGQMTFASAGQYVTDVLDKSGILYTRHILSRSPVIPDENAVGSALMHLAKGCDCLIGIGSGVINDIGKIIASVAKLPYIIVATAPSMDGYASPTSSVERDGFKISLQSTFAYAVVCDLDILCAAPEKMLHAGIGDMLAKHISLCEWKISKIINGEYFCPTVFMLMESALKKCTECAVAFLHREPQAVKQVTEGLLLAGIAMQYAGVSRPASGTEHYFSHIWDMRALAFHKECTLHGIQCGIGTLYSLKVYEYLLTCTPDREKAKEKVKRFDLAKHHEKLSAFIGEAAQVMIQQEQTEKKYALSSHEKRIDTICEKWNEITKEINKLPKYGELYGLMQKIGFPVSAHAFSVTDEEIKTTFLLTKDIRDKYISSRLLWDMGEWDISPVF